MDRLPLVVACALLPCALLSCKQSETRAAASGRQRVNAVQANTDRVDPAEMCDVYHEQGKGPLFQWPALVGDNPKASKKRWLWINVWATWCKPCVEEMPRLQTWENALRSRVALHLVSADTSDEIVAEWRTKHPQTLPTKRLADPSTVPSWLETLGVAGASLPAHVFVAPDGRVRCVRASAVEDEDFRMVEALLR